MFDDLYLNQRTKDQLAAVAKNPKQSYIFFGKESVGKFTSALHLASHIIAPDSTLQKNHLLEGKHKRLNLISLLEDENSISVDQIRDLHSHLKIKVTLKESRVVIIDDAHLMSPEAQNALLKTFEEVPDNTIIFLIASHRQSILPTIYSRASHINYYLPDREELEELLGDLDDKTRKFAEKFDIRTPGTLKKLKQDKKFKEKWLNIHALTLKIIEGDNFDRLSLIKEITKDHEATKSILDALESYYRVNILNSSESSKDRLIEPLESIQKAKHHLNYNVNHKLTISNLMLNL